MSRAARARAKAQPDEAQQVEALIKYRSEPSLWVRDKIAIVPAKRRTEAELAAWLASQPENAHRWCRQSLAAGRLQLDGGCYQSATLDAMAKPGRYAIQWANGTAKTATLALWILWFIETHPGAKIVTTAGTWSQLTMQLWSEIPIWAERAKVPLLSTGRILKTQINIAPDWVCFARGADRAETFEGVHGDYVAIVADEAKAISTDILDGAARRILRGNEGRCWFICLSSPGSPSGYFWDITNGDKSHTWQTMRLSAYESERISLDQIAADAEELGEDSPLFVAMDLGEFPAEGEDTLVPLTHAQAAVGRRVTTEGGNVLGIDVARKGGDYTALVAIHGREVQAPVTAQGQRTTWTAAKAQEMGLRAGYRRIAVDDSVTGDVPVILRRNGRWLDVVPIASLHHKDNIVYSKHTGIEVLSATGWTKIIHSRRHKVAKRLFDVVTTDGRTKVTEDHSLMVGGVEVKPTAIDVGFTIDTRRPEFKHGSIQSYTADLWWAAGLFAAEGSITKNKANQNLLGRIANADRALLEKAQSILEAHFCETCNLMDGGPSETKRMYALRLSRSATAFVEQWCYTTIKVRGHVDKQKATIVERHKKVPIQVLNGTRETQEAWLAGYMEGDGINDRGHLKVDSIDMSLLAGVQCLWEALGWHTRVRVRSDKLNVTTLARVIAGHGAAGDVKLVRELPMARQYVYDLETESHTFVAGLGFLVHHNTGVGGGLSDMLVMAGKPVSEVNFGASDLVKQGDIYANNKTEMYAWLAREMKASYEDAQLPPEQQSLDVGLSLPDGNASKRLVNQLCSIKMHFDGRRFKVEGHKELAARGVKSPDEADALALANWARSRIGRRYEVGGTHGRSDEELPDPDERGDGDEDSMWTASF